MEISNILKAPRLNKLKSGIVAGACLISTGAMASSFTINGAPATNRDILAGVEYDLQYTGGHSSCTDVEWSISKPELDETVIGNSETTKIKEYRKGQYTLTMKSQGRDERWWLFGWWGCNNPDHSLRETVVNLNMNVAGKTQTKHPIMLVPGVLGYDKIVLTGWEYFYQIGDAIMKDSDQKVEDVSLDPWQNTEERGADLANKILDFLIKEDPKFGTPESTMKVNLIAHSHGSTTSRMAINILTDEFGENGKVASLTTVAGPHYGTPTAEGVQWALENWDEGAGTGFINFMMDGLGDLGTIALNLLTGDFLQFNDYEPTGIQEVVRDFTQKGIARFNSCYPSQGLPEGGKYFMEDNLLIDEANPSLGRRPAELNLPMVKSADGQTAVITIDDCQQYANEGTAANSNNNDYDEDSYDFVRQTPSANAEPVVATIQLAGSPNEAYGSDIDFAEYSPEGAGIFGNGKGDPRNGNEPDAIRYFSFTGKGEWNTTWFQTSVFDLASWDLADPIMALFHSAHQLAGARTTSNDFGSWILGLGGAILSNQPVSTEGIPLYSEEGTRIPTGYQQESDAFIPVNTSHFGQFVKAYGPWNHMDEINGLLSATSEVPGADDPLTVYRTHAERLQNSGL